MGQYWVEKKPKPELSEIWPTNNDDLDTIGNVPTDTYIKHQNLSVLLFSSHSHISTLHINQSLFFSLSLSFSPLIQNSDLPFHNATQLTLFTGNSSLQIYFQRAFIFTRFNKIITISNFSDCSILHNNNI